jgi:hypothetical protein
MEEIEKKRKKVNRRIGKYFFFFFFPGKVRFCSIVVVTYWNIHFRKLIFFSSNVDSSFFPNDVIPWLACLRLLVEWASRQGRISFLPFFVSYGFSGCLALGEEEINLGPAHFQIFGTQDRTFITRHSLEKIRKRWQSVPPFELFQKGEFLFQHPSEKSFFSPLIFASFHLFSSRWVREKNNTVFMFFTQRELIGWIQA